MSNPAYQPMDYDRACASLGIDPERPRLPGMKVTYTFEPWQVTGIHRIVEMFNDTSSRAVLLADDTGLGKTH